jgi:hypothetical protein
VSKRRYDWSLSLWFFDHLSTVAGHVAEFFLAIEQWAWLHWRKRAFTTPEYEIRRGRIVGVRERAPFVMPEDDA